jgi:hypothetical protein
VATSTTDPNPALGTEPGAHVQEENDNDSTDLAQQAEEELADIDKPIEPRTWLFEGDFVLKRGDQDIPQHFRGEYIQQPLSYLSFLEFTCLLARKIEEAMRGEDGIKVKDLIETTEGAMPFMVDGSTIESVVRRSDFDGIDTFVQGLMKLVSYVPDVIEECQFIWLGVPRKDRVFLRGIWSRSPDQGGLSPQEGEEMLSLFIDQNYEELETFFVERLPRIGRVVTSARKRMMKIRGARQDDSQRSRPWRATQEPIQSQ